MRKAPFAFTLLALICGFAQANYADESPPFDSEGDEAAGHYRLSENSQLAQSLSATPAPPDSADPAVENPPATTPAGNGYGATNQPASSGWESWRLGWSQANAAIWQIPTDGSWIEPGPPHWYFQADALFLHRSRAHDQVLVVDDANGGIPALSVHDVDFNNSPKAGPMFTMGYKIDPVSAFEVTYFGLNHWTNSTTASGPSNLSIPGPLALSTFDYFLASNVNLYYSSAINNAELNYKQTINNWTLLGGFRYYQMNEQFDMQFTNTSFGLYDVSNYNVKTNNNLLGGQLGIGQHLDLGRVVFDVLGKAGLYGNAAYQSTNMGDFNNTIALRNFNNHVGMLAFLGEVGANATYRLNGCLALRAGYRIMWIDGVVLAPNQVNLTTDPAAGSQVQNRNSIYLHGFNVGLEARW